MIMNYSFLQSGSELRSWVLFYALPVLHGILPVRYFTHFSYLVAALHLLLSDAISMADIKNSYEFLMKFYSQHEQLYGQYNIIWKFAVWKGIYNMIELD